MKRPKKQPKGSSFQEFEIILSAQELQVGAELFEGFVRDGPVEMVFGHVSAKFDRKTIGLTFVKYFGLEVAKERAKIIKVRLKGKDDLFWRYAAAMNFFYELKKVGAGYFQWREIESACKKFLKCKVSINKFKQIISKIPDDKSYPPFDLHKNHLRGQLRALHGQNWPQSYPFPLRDAIYDAVEILYSTYSENLSSQLKDMRDKKTFRKKSKNSKKDSSVFEEPKYEKIFVEVYEHLQLFGIKLDGPKVVDNIFYHHKTQGSQNKDP